MDLNEAAKTLRSTLIAEARKMAGDSGFLGDCSPHEDDILVRCSAGSPIEQYIPTRFKGHTVRKSYYQTAYEAS